MQELCKKNVKKLQKRFFPYICGMEKLRHGSLFSGIGGFDLAAEWMGWDNVFHCEWNEFGQKVLKHYWPQAESFSDITKTDFTKYYGTVDIITGGFPASPTQRWKA
jgi:DNA (cytosine-5)-methyltransferase 1